MLCSLARVVGFDCMISRISGSRDILTMFSSLAVSMASIISCFWSFCGDTGEEARDLTLFDISFFFDARKFSFPLFKMGDYSESEESFDYEWIQPELRESQTKCATKTWNNLMYGGTACIVAPTGGGKTVITVALIQNIIDHHWSNFNEHVHVVVIGPAGLMVYDSAGRLNGDSPWLREFKKYEMLENPNFTFDTISYETLRSNKSVKASEDSPMINESYSGVLQSAFARKAMEDNEERGDILERFHWAEAKDYDEEDREYIVSEKDLYCTPDYGESSTDILDGKTDGIPFLQKTKEERYT